MNYLTSILAILCVSVSVLGCNEKHRRSPPPPEVAPVVSEAPPPAPVIPPEPIEGRLITGYYKAHPELKFSISPAEPQAPRGKWSKTPAGFIVWIPEWLDRAVNFTKRDLALIEIDTTVPEPDARLPLGIKGPNPADPPRIVILDPGGFSYAIEGRDLANDSNISGLATGLYLQKAWPEHDPTTGGIVMRDVIFVAWRFPNTLAKFLPALNHELRHHWLQDRLGE